MIPYQHCLHCVGALHKEASSYCQLELEITIFISIKHTTHVDHATFKKIEAPPE